MQGAMVSSSAAVTTVSSSSSCNVGSCLISTTVCAEPPSNPAPAGVTSLAITEPEQKVLDTQRRSLSPLPDNGNRLQTQEESPETEPKIVLHCSVSCKSIPDEASLKRNRLSEGSTVPSKADQIKKQPQAGLSSPPDRCRAHSSVIGMKRMSDIEDNISNENSPTKKSRSTGDMELRLLIQTKTAGSIIGKGGANISRLRSEYPATIAIPDCPGPERVLTISGPESSVVKILEEVLTALDECHSLGEAAMRSGESDIRILVHQSQAGAIIGKGGSKIKELRELCGGQVKVYGNCCPQSADRVIQVMGDQQRVLLTCLNILEALKETTIKGPENQYSPYNYDEYYSQEYGGWGEGPKGRFPPMGGMGPRPPMGGPGGHMGGRGPMGGPGGHMGPNGGLLPPFGGGDRRRGGSGGGGPFSPPRSGPPMRNDFDDMMQDDGGSKGGFLNGNSLMGSNGSDGGLTTSTQVTIPKEAAGAIIGKGGARICKIRADSCCSISIEDARPGSNDRIITITGGEQQIKHAQYLLQQSVREFGGPIGRRNY